ncbi:rhomboid family intramembrane serine protease [Luteolibacter luteus]|uniref:Rhomboid family intramembrane serine protease n=1 Tax=Luteolibacter luteus TaxID=2728835 RepID=A0A858RKF2_9BACT|nr:rhomboid family intramembrane serine protease [Luteolibacter luteus]QJE97332.1 rhomboid family intramembrane serine protease [Luteolibacter luteus]
MTLDAELPAWARDDAFPEAGPGWGWVDRKGNRFDCDSFAALSRVISEDLAARVDLVWTPDSPGLVLPEEISELHPALKMARIRWAEWDIEEGRRQMTIFGIAFVVLLVFGGLKIERILSNGTLGLAALLFVILGLFPWYKGRKRLQRARKWAAGEMIADAPALRFETWLAIQKAPVTRLLLGLMVLAGLTQVVVEIHAFNQRHSLHGFASFLALINVILHLGALDGGGHVTVGNAGLSKGALFEWWRLCTAPFLHGHWLHWLMNASALAYLGKRVETFARWPHLVMVFLISAWIGGEASARFTSVPSVGASGGLMGLLGFLLVFETLHRTLVPESSRRRLLAGVVFTGIIGFLFRHFIDNAAHVGGLVAGMVYAAFVFPRSSSPHRPRTTMVDVVLGGAALGLVVSAAIFACIKMV